MTFKRIDEETVCCIVTEDDMIDNGLEIEDFLQNKDKVQDFLHSIVEQAEVEVGYEMKKGILSMQVAMLPEHKLAITFSEKENLGIRDMVDQMKKAMSVFEEEPQTGGEIVRGLEKEIREEKGSNQVWETDSQEEISFEEKKQRSAVLTFDTMKQALEACHFLKEESTVESSFYRMDEKYYLLLDSVKMKNASFLKICGTVMEYGHIECSTEERIAYIKEHGTCLLKKKAFTVLAKV